MLNKYFEPKKLKNFSPACSGRALVVAGSGSGADWGGKTIATKPDSSHVSRPPGLRVRVPPSRRFRPEGDWEPAINLMGACMIWVAKAAEKVGPVFITRRR